LALGRIIKIQPLQLQFRPRIALTQFWATPTESENV